MASNRIEVDLKLLQDKNAQKLLEFGQQFSKSVDSLGKMLKDYASQVAGATQASENVTGAGRNASIAKDVKITGGQARMGGEESSGVVGYTSTGWPIYGQPGSFANAPGGSYGGGGGTSMPPSPPRSPGYRSSGSGGEQAGQFEKEYIQAIRRIGGRESIPVGLRQVFGYAAEGQLPFIQKQEYMVNPMTGKPLTDLDNNPIPLMTNRGQVVQPGYKIETNDQGEETVVPGRAMRFGKTISDTMFSMEAISANLHRFNQEISGIRNNIIGTSMTGVNLGYSRAGILGTPLFSPAWQAAMSNSFQAMRASDFGLSMSYSPEQAQQALQAIQNAGWSGTNQTSWMLNFLKHQQNQGITPETTMAFLDPYLRFGGAEDLTTLHDILNSLGPAAKAANMNLAEFQQQIVSTATEINQSTGMGFGAAATALTSFSSVTGMAPSKAAGLLSDPKNLMMASALSGQSMNQLMMTGHNQMGAAMQFGEMQFSRAVGGMTPQEITKGLHAPKGSPEYERADKAMSAAWMVYEMNPNAFGGFSPKEWLNMGERAGSYQGVLTRESVMQRLSSVNIASLSGTGGQTFKSLIEEYAGPNKKYAGSIEREMSADFEKWIKGKGKKYAGTTMEDLEKQREHKKQWLLDRLNNQNQKHARQAANKVTIGLTQDAAKWFKIMNSEYKNNTNNSVGSTISHYARKAMHIGEDTIELMNPIDPHPIRTAQHLIHDIGL